VGSATTRCAAGHAQGFASKRTRDRLKRCRIGLDRENVRRKWAAGAVRPEVPCAPGKVLIFGFLQVVGVALITLACAHEPEMVWVKPGATDADFDQMRARCLSQAGIADLPPSTAMAHFGACMESDGWMRVPKEKANEPRFIWLKSDGTPAPSTELEAAKAECRTSTSDDPNSPRYPVRVLQCMQSKGYRLVEEDK